MDVTHYALYLVGKEGEEKMLRPVRGSPHEASRDARMRAHAAVADGPAAPAVHGRQDRPITDVVQSLAESATLARIVFKRRDDPMMIKAHPEILAVRFGRCATGWGGRS